MLLGHLKYAPHIPVSTIDRNSLAALPLRALDTIALKSNGIYSSIDVLDTHGIQYAFRTPATRVMGNVQPILHPFSSLPVPSTTIGSSILVNVCLTCIDMEKYENFIDKYVLSDPTSVLSKYLANNLWEAAPTTIKELLPYLESLPTPNVHADIFRMLSTSVSMLWDTHANEIDDLLPELSKLGKLLTHTNRNDFYDTAPIDSIPMSDIDWSACESPLVKKMINTNVISYDRDVASNKHTLTFSFITTSNNHTPEENNAAIGFPKFAKVQYYRYRMRNSMLLRFKNEFPSYIESAQKPDTPDPLVNLKAINIAETLTPQSTTDPWLDTLQSNDSEEIPNVGILTKHTFDLSILVDMVNELENIVIPELTRDVTRWSDVLSTNLKGNHLVMAKFTSVSPFTHTVSDYKGRQHSLPYNTHDIGDVIKGHIDAFPVGIKTVQNLLQAELDIAFELQERAFKDDGTLPFEASIVVAEQILAAITKLRNQLYAGPRSNISYATDSLSTYINTVNHIFMSAPEAVVEDSKDAMSEFLVNLNKLANILVFYTDIFNLYDEVLLSLQSLVISGIYAAFINVNEATHD